MPETTTSPDVPHKKVPSDDEIAAMLAAATPGKKKARDMNAPSPRMPEALYYYLFIMVEAVLVMGVWGFMRRGPEAVMKGPSLDAPVSEQIGFHLMSIVRGVGDLALSQPWVPAGVLLLAGAVFVPTTPRQRKRMASLVSTVIVVIFVLLIAMQFSDDMSALSGSADY